MKSIENYKNKTISEIEGKRYPVPNRDDVSFLTWRVYTLREKKISDFNIEDLRILISQHIALEYLIPIALEKLEENPFYEGDFYEGDLLNAVLTTPGEFWQNFGQLKDQLKMIIKNSLKQLDQLDSTDEIKNKIFTNMDPFI